MNTETTIKLRIPGKKIEDGKGLDWRQEQITVSNVRTYILGTTRGETGERPVETAQLNDVVEVELENGLRFWTTAESLRDEVFAELGTERGAADDVFDIPMNLPQKSGQRGLGGIIIKALRFFGVDIPQLGARKIALGIENHALKDGLGTQLYRCSKTENFELTRVISASDIPTNKPALLLLHGTGSSTQGSFGELWNDADSNWNRRDSWINLLKKYDTVLALEHRSLTENPVQNVITLVNSLPDGITLHVISHSRGGMVGELLCRGSASDEQPPFSTDELEYFRKKDPKHLRGNLEQLNSLLRDKKIHVECFVRTACPARGTTLASDRLDIYFSVLRALLHLIPNIADVVLDGFAELAAGIAGQRTDPSVLPGIEAMIPDSPLVNVLNNPTARVNGRLRVISGDIEGGTLASTFLALLADPLYQSDNDLVVNTDSMFSGAARTDGAAYVFYRGSEISHFKYFTNQPSVRKLEAALAMGATVEDGFTSYDIRSEVKPNPTRGHQEKTPRATVYLLPGIMGSHLALDNDRIWLDIVDLMPGGMEKLKLGAFNIKAEQVIQSSYNPMYEMLSSRFNVETFPYDWRLSVTDAAKKLAEAITRKLDILESKNFPVSIVAHSMGGIVMRAMIANHQDVWQRMSKHKESRVVMLGTPNGGSHAIGMVLTGRDSVMRGLAMIDRKHDMEELLDIVREYPGVAEMLPYELLNSSVWPVAPIGGIQYSPPTNEILNNARTVWDNLKANAEQITPEKFYYIAGQAKATPIGMRLEGNRLVFDATPRGDGRVPWETGIPKGVRTWYANALHGDLCKSVMCLPAVLDILLYGNTDRLPNIAPGNRGMDDKFEMPKERSILHPNQEELEAAALCGSPDKLTTNTISKIKVKVVHGSLEFASYPILVGHYSGDTLVSAEAALDRHLDGRLLASLRLGLHPGEINTAQFFSNAERKPKGAIVVGLGEVGALTPGALESTVSRGIRTYATSQVDNRGNTCAPHTGVSVLLVGTNDAGLSVATSIAAILRGIDKGLQNLEKHDLANSLILEEVELIELYEDIAIHAAHALEDASKDTDLTRRFNFDGKPQVYRQRGGMRRASSRDVSDWWQRLAIKEDKQGQLTFKLLTDRARAETYLQPCQRKLVDQFIEDALADNTPTNSAASTLFHMLTPNNLKQYAPDQRNLLLVLNKAAARYPWELMAARSRDDKDNNYALPMSVRAGMLRQLQLKSFREKVIHSSGKNVLVIGNPKIGMRCFPDLPGAAKEAAEVVAKLTTYAYSPVPVIKTSAKEILTALYAQDYRILHLSGHGVYDYEVRESNDSCLNKKAKLVSGMVIGDDLFITPAEIRQMVMVPELAFINCCNLGKVDDIKTQNLPGLAANLGAELIGMGVRAVVAAGWAVNDEGARIFANTFYDAMLSGKNFGHAVRSARKAVFDNNPNDNTWGAYQCYGDPSFVLGEGGNTSKPAQNYSFVMPGEAVIELNNTIEEAYTAQESRIGSLQKRVQAIHDAIPLKWLDMGKVLSALGQAWGELGQYDKAVELLEKSMASKDGETTLKSIEQLCNFRARWAVQAFDQAKVDTAMQQLTLAEKEITKVLSMGVTSERWAVKGSVIKRHALILAKKIIAGEDNIKAELVYALNEIDHCYEKANQLFKKRNQKNDPYPLLNSSATKILQAMLQNDVTLDIGKLNASLILARDAGEQGDAQTPCFWSAIAPVECQLLEGLADESLPSRADEIVKGYMDAKQRDGSPREFLSVKEHLDYLMTVAQAAESNMSEPLRKIRDRLN
ncbi:MAG: CHAT domain-containing protein [Gallionella sp.]|jgi:pimeloyl-ACP methyl ester carboxylesterase/tetratricopeptide (TPR) repeat protein